ncbi:MAG TPA: FHA domain-containing protein [Planctomycetota bacterium]|nr:FHA domain-containing protein [Planctomycetota bacterium]
MAKIAQLHDNIDKTRYHVLRRENILGRAPECNILVDNPVVSRHHAHIARTRGTNAYYVEDISARGTYVNFGRILARHPLKEGDRICVIRFHNVHPKELERMSPEQLHDCCEDPRVEGIKAVADLTFGYIEVSEAQAAAQTQADDEKPKGLLGKLKALLGKK